MSQIVPNPNARQIRQALEQGLRGIAKAAAFIPTFGVFAQPLIAKFVNFVCSKSIAIVPTSMSKTAAFSDTFDTGIPLSAEFVVQVTADTSKTASFVATGTAAIVPESGTYDLTLEVALNSGEAGSFTAFESLAEVFQI